MNRTRQISLWKRQIPRPVDLVHQPAVGLAGGGELVVVLFQHPAQVQGGLAFCFEFGLLDSGAGRGAEAAAVGTRSLSSGLSEAEFVLDLWSCGAVRRRDTQAMPPLVQQRPRLGNGSQTEELRSPTLSTATSSPPA